MKPVHQSQTEKKKNCTQKPSRQRGKSWDLKLRRSTSPAPISDKHSHWEVDCKSTRTLSQPGKCVDFSVEPTCFVIHSFEHSVSISICSSGKRQFRRARSFLNCSLLENPFLFWWCFLSMRPDWTITRLANKSDPIQPLPAFMYFTTKNSFYILKYFKISREKNIFLCMKTICHSNMTIHE